MFSFFARMHFKVSTSISASSHIYGKCYISNKTTQSWFIYIFAWEIINYKAFCSTMYPRLTYINTHYTHTDFCIPKMLKRTRWIIVFHINKRTEDGKKPWLNLFCEWIKFIIHTTRCSYKKKQNINRIVIISLLFFLLLCRLQHIFT